MNWISSNWLPLAAVLVAAAGVVATWVTVLRKPERKLRAYDRKKESARDEWPIYQVAFLWHGFEPPSTRLHFWLMTREVEETKRMLHQAVEARALRAAREVRSRSGLTRFVTRSELRRFCDASGMKPEFLFPEAKQ
jgi:hypothetical protein